MSDVREMAKAHAKHIPDINLRALAHNAFVDGHASRDAELAAKDAALQISAAQFDKALARIQELHARVDAKGNFVQRLRERDFEHGARIATLEQCVTDWVDTDLASKRRIAALTSALDEAEKALKASVEAIESIQSHTVNGSSLWDNIVGPALTKIREVRNG